MKKTKIKVGATSSDLNRHLILRNISSGHPYLIILAFQDFMLLADLLDPTHPTNMKVLLKRDYERFETDQNTEVKVEKIYEEYWKDYNFYFSRK